MKNNAQKINFIRLFSLFSTESDNLNHGLTLGTWFKGGMYTPHEILTSTYGMGLKFELVLVFDRSRR